MKLYYNTTKRIAKKVLGLKYWRKLNYARNLKPGNLISTCIGWNQVIEEIQPEWCFDTGLLKGRIVGDFDIITTDGSSHSVTHCCSFPLETREQINLYWSGTDTFDYQPWKDISSAIERGEEVFMSDGTRNPEWKAKEMMDAQIF